jgi:hypothetical protein
MGTVTKFVWQEVYPIEIFGRNICPIKYLRGGSGKDPVPRPITAPVWAFL